MHCWTALKSAAYWTSFLTQDISNWFFQSFHFRITEVIFFFFFCTYWRTMGNLGPRRLLNKAVLLCHSHENQLKSDHIQNYTYIYWVYALSKHCKYVLKTRSRSLVSKIIYPEPIWTQLSPQDDQPFANLSKHYNLELPHVQ